MRMLFVPMLLLAALAVPAAASARAPSVVTLPVDDSIVFAGADSPCGFDITFTSTGTVKATTFFDGDGNPLRQTIHGSLTHTFFSAWHTLVSKGPAPVHIDLAAGQMVDTGMEYSFHLPGDGVIFGQAGRLTFAADGSFLSFVGMSVSNTDLLCAALAP
jgi:hypothetical protein